MNKKKLLTVVSLIAVMMISSAFIRADYGIELKNSNTGNLVYKAIYAEEGLCRENGFNEDVFFELLQSDSVVANYDHWDYKSIDKYDEKNNHYIGGRYQTEPAYKSIEYYMWILTHDTTDIKYKEKKTLTERTITITLKPEKPVELAGGVTFEKPKKAVEHDVYDYYFVIETPTTVTSTNGTIKGDGKIVEWDIDDAITKGETVELTVTFKNNKPLIIIGIVVAVVLIIFVLNILRNRNKVVVESNNVPLTPMRPTYSEPEYSVDETPGEALKYTKGYKCPKCGSPLKDNDNFCDKCGEFV